MDTSNEEMTPSQEKQPEVGIPGLEVPDDTNENQNTVDEIIIDDTDSIVTENSVKLDNDNAEINDQKTNMSYEEEDDDVIIHEVVPEKIILDDDDGKDDYTYYEPTLSSVKKETVEDDGFMDVEDGILKSETFENVRIKSEPIDPGTIYFSLHKYI